MATSSTPRRWLWVAAVAIVAVVIRLALGVLTWEPGWSALTWDDFTRVAIAGEWADAPFWFNGFVWLPLPVWITGSVYALVGELFTTNPMVLMAIINTIAIVVAAAVSAWSAHRVFTDPLGTLVAFILVLFAPWNYFLSLSGLAEPLYFVAITVAGAGLISWAASGSNGSLAIGSLGVAAAAAMRYEGWWLAAAWLLVVIGDTIVLMRRRSIGPALRERVGTLLIAGAPLGVPLAWMGVNLVEKGSPLFFAHESARIFGSAYGGLNGRVERIVYYPMALIRSAPFLFILEGLIAFLRRKQRAVILLTALFATQFLLFYLASLWSEALGAFPERFLFAFALGLAPLAGGLPNVIRGVVPARAVRVVGVALLSVGILVTGVRLQDRPEEWTHAPDLLALNEQIGTVVLSGRISAVAGEGMESDHIPLRVQNGARVGLSIANEVPAGSLSEFDLWVERSPAHVVDFQLEDAPAIGRYHLMGSIADQLTLPPCGGCDGWTWVDETGFERTIHGGPYLGLEFITDNPAPGQTAGLVKTIAQSAQPQKGSVDLRWLYGHGFNHGRIGVVATLDGVAIFETDIGEPSRWTRVDFDVPAGEGASELRVAVVALDGIEPGWGWGRVSTVLIRELVVGPQ